jgi:hypothetical protein
MDFHHLDGYHADRTTQKRRSFVALLFGPVMAALYFQELAISSQIKTKGGIE